VTQLLLVGGETRLPLPFLRRTAVQPAQSLVHHRHRPPAAAAPIGA
jgi:hypothetical protein